MSFQGGEGPPLSLRFPPAKAKGLGAGIRRCDEATWFRCSMRVGGAVPGMSDGVLCPRWTMLGCPQAVAGRGAPPRSPGSLEHNRTRCFKLDKEHTALHGRRCCRGSLAMGHICPRTRVHSPRFVHTPELPRKGTSPATRQARTRGGDLTLPDAELRAGAGGRAEDCG